MIALEPGTILEREYKGENIKVKVLKDGTYSFNGKAYETRGSLMKAITKGKIAQFSTFFELDSEEEDSGDVEEASNGKSALPVSMLEASIRSIVIDEIKNYFRTTLGGTNA